MDRWIIRKNDNKIIREKERKAKNIVGKIY